MRIEKIPPTPQVLMEFAAEGLQRLGALCERTWHDRLQVVADGPAAATLGRPGELVETELCFPEGTDLDPVRDVFPGCPLAFRMAEELWKQMPRVFRAALPVVIVRHAGQQVERAREVAVDGLAGGAEVQIPDLVERIEHRQELAHGARLADRRRLSWLRSSAVGLVLSTSSARWPR